MMNNENNTPTSTQTRTTHKLYRLEKYDGRLGPKPCDYCGENADYLMYDDDCAVILTICNSCVIWI